MNTIYKQLLKIKIDKFIYDFNSSKKVFEDLKKKNKLLHPGEYGTFRENICKEILEFAIPQKFSISTGFLINSYDEVSTQCDVVIYDLNNTPLITEGNNNRFFPVEPVLAIGEMKSSLSIQDLCDALVKISNIKKLKRIDQIFCINHVESEIHNPQSNPFDTIFTFIICEKIDGFNFDKLKEKIVETYKQNEIPSYLFHNVILSLNDGVIIYNNQYEHLRKGIKKNQKMYMPSAIGKDFEIYHQNIDVYHSVQFLLTSLSNFLMNANIYYPEPNAYD